MNIYPDEELDGTNEGLDITGNNPPEGGGAVEEPSITNEGQTTSEPEASANENPQEQ